MHFSDFMPITNACIGRSQYSCHRQDTVTEINIDQQAALKARQIQKYLNTQSFVYNAAAIKLLVGGEQPNPSKTLGQVRKALH